MASIAMTPTFLGGAVPKHPTTGHQRGVVVMAKASKVISEGVSFKNERISGNSDSSGSGRRDLVFAAASAAAALFVVKAAVADEPKPGTPEAKKKYAAVCVTMPTARICRKGPSIN